MKKSALLITKSMMAAVMAAMLFAAPAFSRVAYAENNEKTTVNKEETVEEVKEEAKEETKEEVKEEESNGAEEAQEEVLSEYDKAIKEAADARHALQNDPTHVHHYRWIAKMNESESADGTINYMCEECDKVWYFRPYPAYHCFQGDIARQIEVAPENFTIKVKTSLFYSFDKRVMQALADRPDVSLYVSFLRNEYIGDRLSFVIPAGEDTMSLLDENGYAGFIFLGNKYGMTLEEKHEIAEDAETEETEETEASETKTEPAEETEEKTAQTEKTEIKSADKQR
jgi:archaellum component FlaD/FlaE